MYCMILQSKPEWLEHLQTGVSSWLPLPVLINLNCYRWKKMHLLSLWFRMGGKMVKPRYDQILTCSLSIKREQYKKRTCFIWVQIPELCYNKTRNVRFFSDMHYYNNDFVVLTMKQLLWPISCHACYKKPQNMSWQAQELDCTVKETAHGFLIIYIFFYLRMIPIKWYISLVWSQMCFSFFDKSSGCHLAWQQT